MKKNILIFGKNGQIGSSLINCFAQHQEFAVNSYTSAEVTFTDLEKLFEFLQNLKKIPDFIINAAAYTNVDKAEDEYQLADIINNKAVAVIANYCLKNNVKLIHYSTDYVFDGTGTNAFTEDNTENLHPLNYYGKSKLAGEQSIISSKCHYIILRTSWIYNQTGKNFVNTIKKLAQEKEMLNIVSDQIGSPTSAEFVAFYTIAMIKKLSENLNEFPKGIYHLTCGQYVSWYQFALKIVSKLEANNSNLKVKTIVPIKTLEYTTSTARPLNSRLDCRKFQKVFGIKLKLLNNDFNFEY